MTDRPDPPAGEAPPPRPAERARRPYAVVVENERAGRAPGTSVAPPSRFEITARETIVGRDPSCAIRLDNLFVSRRHARLLLRGATLHLDDLASTNVTRRNGDPVYTRVQVHSGDVLHFASVRCRVVEASPHPDDEAAEERPAGAAESAEGGSAPPEGGSAPPEAGAAPVGTAEAASGPLPAEPPTTAPASDDGEGEGGGVEEPGAPAPAAEAPPARPTPAPVGDDGPSEETGEGEGAPGEGGSAGGEEPGLEARPAPGDAPAAPVSSNAPVSPNAPASPNAPVTPAAPVPPAASVVRTGPIFVAGPLPGEPRRTRLRAALWGLALAALAALAAVVLL